MLPLVCLFIILIFWPKKCSEKITLMIDYYFNYLFFKKIHKHLSIQLCFNRNYVDDVPVMEFILINNKKYFIKEMSLKLALC